MRLVSLLLVRAVLLTACISSMTFAAEPATGFRAEVLHQIADAEKKSIALAEAMPQEKYTWRPAPGVRSIGEVYMHIAGANFMLPTMIGGKRPTGLKPDMEKTVTEKAKVVEMMKNSYANIREVIESMTDADLNTEVNMFGNKTTKRGALLLMSDHLHEHLGQSIAYARMNGVTPPWSAGKAE